MSIQQRLESALSVALTAAAIVIAAAVARREFSGRSSDSAARQRDDGGVVFVESWKTVLPHGILVGDSTARASLIEFLDLECPACRRFNTQVLDSVRSRFGGDLAITFVHLPLTFHRFSRIAARASECAYVQGRFPQFVDAVYARQDSLGLKSWGSFATDAQVADTVGFVACVRSSAPLARVDSGVAVAARLGVAATPTVLLNGWRFSQPPSAAILGRAIQAVLAGKSPE